MDFNEIDATVIQFVASRRNNIPRKSLDYKIPLEVFLSYMNNDILSSLILQLADNKIFQSMSRKGNCLDNSLIENFFSLLKQEIYYGKTYYSFELLEKSIEEWIYYYNNKRIKLKLDGLSPVNHRLKIYA